MIAVDLQVFGYGYRIYTMWKGLDWHKAYGKLACMQFVSYTFQCFSIGGMKQ